LTESFREFARHACVGVALVVVPFVAQTARAQTAPRLERVEVALWPEYDKPSVLVVLRAWLPADAALPTSVAFRVPASTGVPHATAKRAADGTLLMAPFTRDVEGDVATITIATDLPEVRLEYYMPLEATGTERAFSFEWLGGPEVARLAYEVQQPPTASALSVTPPSSQQGTAPDGLVYHRGELGRVAAGEAKTVRATYTKATAGLTVAALRPPSPQPGTASTPVVPPSMPPSAGNPAGMPSSPGVPPGMPPSAGNRAGMPSSPGVPPGMPPAGATASPNSATGEGRSSTWIIVILVGLLVAIGGAWVALSGKATNKPSAGPRGD
jgi:hypothetical protein